MKSHNKTKMLICCIFIFLYPDFYKIISFSKKFMFQDKKSYLLFLSFLYFLFLFLKNGLDFLNEYEA